MGGIAEQSVPIGVIATKVVTQLRDTPPKFTRNSCVIQLGITIKDHLQWGCNFPRQRDFCPN